MCARVVSQPLRQIGWGSAHLECGILAHGFLRLRCGERGHDKLLAFSCKRRGFCPSCGAGRLDAALHNKALAKVFRAKVLDAIERAGLVLPDKLPATPAHAPIHLRRRRGSSGTGPS